jgi:hypothetical protein
LNERAIASGRANVVAPDTTLVRGSMADAKLLTNKSGVDNVDVVFTSAAAMHCDDDIFAAAKAAALSPAKRAIIVHLKQ